VVKKLFGCQDYRGLVIPTFANLKHLELIIEDDCYRARRNLISFLKASPYLQRLVLKVRSIYIPTVYCIVKLGLYVCTFSTFLFFIFYLLHY
jgi:hypothetical protein